MVISQGDTGEDIATTLRDAGVTKTRTAYLEAAVADPQSAAKIQPGTYVLLKGMRGQDAFAILIDPANRVADRVTVREGLWKSETFAALSKATGVPVAEYEKAAKDTKAIGLPAVAGGDVEGWLFPASYEFDDKTTASEQLKQMVALDHEGPRGRRCRPTRTGSGFSPSPRSSRARPVVTPTAARSPASSRTGWTNRTVPPRASSRWTPRSTTHSRSAATSPRASTTARSPTPTTPTGRRDCPRVRSAARARPPSRPPPTPPRVAGSSSSRSTSTPARPCSRTPSPNSRPTSAEAQRVVQCQPREVQRVTGLAPC